MCNLPSPGGACARSEKAHRNRHVAQRSSRIDERLIIVGARDERVRIDAKNFPD
ncbi:hypothetical protein [Bradyrhizobium sp. HKCCYLRH3061]|uniref:hypothetical protein n=1 Tax=Bradyrhizobium sp. HKCCYLRH3061 TaxID=3420734 RepID=UPI003EC135CC